MIKVLHKIDGELQRLKYGASLSDKPGGVGAVIFFVRCPFGISAVLTKAKAVLEAVDEAVLLGWPENGEIILDLPEWFVSACEAEMSEEQAKVWFAWFKELPLDEQIRVENEKKWSLSNWLYWMEPNNRQWFWWDIVEILGEDRLTVAVIAEAWPFPYGAFKWLFYAAGALSIEAEGMSA